MIVPYDHILLLATSLFLMGVLCALMRRNLIMILVGVEIMLNASAVLFVGASLRWQQMEGQVCVLCSLAIAAAEGWVGRARFVYAYRRTGSVRPETYDVLRG